ncbi:Uncharacterised protein [Mycobacteroides abscessus subsp. abscessus]|uniref:hypothetical protein n=1 Tax=Mycobacteroides abscessus TaxID=36809 RepID=UPI000926C56B|nr:hypothetical protein [Mycobacteroides abscessus]MBE5514406.1 hypothetical protein [Mycobacteroides abscessus]SIK17329.1 Uncharacterised protein [Mycobacteroides abscessus subsp. abscessus]SLC96684.1 Uncharacterised protein [Mycobacteroides abscessus subsp. massiliense]SLD96439.1 Uncharacterised protein [Mycobacteroides abscessus subsp. massiliense]SLF29675.1 Uncharacterised protein [Mycobacteroides abscessus subsp. massiliense]
MTLHKVTICDHWHWLLWDGKLTHLPCRADEDYQAGDCVVFEGRTWREWKITHVLNNASMPGVVDGYVILSLEHPDKTERERQYHQRYEIVESLRRSNAALRGVITRLRNQISMREHQEVVSS